jgi:hypothetical protein
MSSMAWYFMYSTAVNPCIPYLILIEINRNHCDDPFVPLRNERPVFIYAWILYLIDFIQKSISNQVCFVTSKRYLTIIQGL